MNNLDIPSSMKAVWYTEIGKFDVRDIPVPEVGDDEVLLKVKSCGICGTDLHIHDGDFDVRMPLVTGHETSGIVVKIGTNVRGFNIGDKVTADSTGTCGSCHYCRRGTALYCENFAGHGTQLNGGFAEYCTFSASKLFHFQNCTWTEASLFEATACAVHSMDRVKPSAGSSILMLGAGPTGLIMAQLMKMNCATHLVLASNSGQKMQLARSLGVADEYVDLDRSKSATQLAVLKEKYPFGFDVVIEATGSIEVLENALDLCTRGGKLLVYGVYPAGKAQLCPMTIMQNEITVLGSFSEMFDFPRAVRYLEDRKVNVKGIVTHTYPLEEFGSALDALKKKECVKATIMM